MQESLYSRSTVLGRKLLACVFCGQSTAVKTFSRMEFFVKLCPQDNICGLFCMNGGTVSDDCSTCSCVKPWSGPLCSNDGNSDGCTCSFSGNWTGLECDECNLSCGENEILDTENCFCKCKNDYFGSHCEKSCEEDFGAVRDGVFKEMCKSSSQNAVLCSKTCGTCTSEFGICVDDKRYLFLRRVAVKKATKSFCSKLAHNECSHICCLVQ